MIRVTVDMRELERGIQQTKAAIQQAAELAWDEGTDGALTFMRANGYMDRTGKLSRSMRAVVRRNGFLRFRTILEARAKYALWVDQPTKPHPIPLPTNLTAKILRFYWRKMGGIVFFKRVNHPGTKGAFFSRSTESEYGILFPVILQNAIDRALSQA